MRAKCPEEEFKTLCRALGPAGTARVLGTSERAVHNRRRQIEARTGEKIVVNDTRYESKTQLDPGLLRFATPEQARILDTVLRCRSNAEAARQLKIGHMRVGRTIEAVRVQAVRQGYSPEHGWTREVPSPHVVGGISTLYDNEGKIRAQWVKTKLTELQQLEAVQAFVDGLMDGAEGKSKLVKPPKFFSDRLMCVLPMGDPHFGMYAWGAEAGEDFDVDIAERDLRAAVHWLVSQTPESAVCVVLPLGDYLHADNYEGLTSRSGNRLDVDTRWPRVLALGAKLLIWCVEEALKKHNTVIVKALPGNHDDHSSVAIGLILEAYFRNNDRVTVDTGAGAFWYYRFEKVLLCSTHGHNTKPDQLPHIMSADRPKDVGETLFRTWLTGHIHTRRVFEYPTCTVETFRTLAGRDAYLHSRGYRSGRDMHAIMFDREFGEVQRFRADVELVRTVTE